MAGIIIGIVLAIIVIIILLSQSMVMSRGLCEITLD